MIARLYRKLIPQNLRNDIYDKFLGDSLVFVRNFSESIKSVYIYLFQKILPKTEKNALYAFMGKHGLTFYPYPFYLEYKKRPIACFWDEYHKMYYFVLSNKKVYYPAHSNRNKREIIANYRSLLIEQDRRSPHRYVDDLDHLSGKTILDIGAAEGIFSLSCIEKIKHVYLFECDEQWIQALHITFEPWKEKVTIVPKYVSDNNDDKNITIDSFLEGKEKTNLFLKMDIEGNEQKALQGSLITLKETEDLDYAICTYHNTNDAVEINKILLECNLESEYTDGFLYYEKEFRKGIIHKKKK
ncbi:hypothetical protein AGMMS50262_11650 [Bacteroidia bacterium]|nr:hypothetical protein AGMMS50262_11650 [Bacteroidia bacterium]